MSLSIFPNTNVQGVTGLPVCFEGSAIYSLSQEDERCIDLPVSGTNWVFSSGASCQWQRISGTNGLLDAVATQANPVYGLQPFYIQAINLTFTTPPSPNRFYGSYVGATSADGSFYGWYVWKNCGNQSQSECNATTDDNDAQNWKGFIISDDIIVTPIPIGVNASEIFRLRSNGISLFWERKTAGVWQTAYTQTIPTTDNWTFFVASLFNSNSWHFVNTFRGSFQGTVPITWSAPAGGVLTGTGNTRCFTVSTPGTYQVCIESEFESPLCVDVEVADLYFDPVDFDCGECVFTGETVNFQSNGGLNGVLTASHGTVIDALTWQAPTFPIEATLTYTLGTEEVQCNVRVVEEFRATNVGGNEILGLLPGETFQIETNYDPPNGTVLWQNLTCERIVSPTGLITIPTPSSSNCFGALDCTIRAVLVEIEGDICDNLISTSVGDEDYTYLDFRIIVQPLYPTPEYGGPPYLKWKQETPDFRVLVNTFEGGCDETYIRNKVPVYKWMVRYGGLAQDFPCPPDYCCEDPVGYVGGYDASYQSVARLDEFWNLVFGQYGYFTLKEPRTGRIWRNVRFDTTVERDHINWQHSQSRDFTLIWSPCCESEPAGGTCDHVTVIIYPGNPINLVGTAQSESVILWEWDAPIINFEFITHYILQIAPDSSFGINVDEYSILATTVPLQFTESGLLPATTRFARVKAVDNSGNESQWSNVASATTPSEGSPSDSSPGSPGAEGLVIFDGEDVIFDGDEVGFS